MKQSEFLLGVVLLSIVTLGCAPTMYEKKAASRSPTTYPVGFDSAWEAVLNVLEEAGEVIASMDKTSYLIKTEKLSTTKSVLSKSLLAYPCDHVLTIRFSKISGSATSIRLSVLTYNPGTGRVETVSSQVADITNRFFNKLDAILK